MESSEVCLWKGSQCYPNGCHFNPGWVSFLPVCNEPQWGWTLCSPMPCSVFTNELLNKSELDPLLPNPSPGPFSIPFQFTNPALPVSSHLAVSPSPHNEQSRTPFISCQHRLSPNCECLFVVCLSHGQNLFKVDNWSFPGLKLILSFCIFENWCAICNMQLYHCAPAITLFIFWLI